MRLICTLAVMLMLVMNDVRGQGVACGTEATARYLAPMQAHAQQIHQHALVPSRTPRTFATSVYIMRQSDGSGGMSMNEFEQIFAELNAMLAPAGITLAVCDSIRYIDSDLYYDFSKVQESSLTNQHYVPQTINLYFPNSVVTGSGTVLCGYAYFPGWQDVVIVDRHCALDGSSLVHEMGHYFGLLHTHGISNALPTDELADFSNCLAAGDDVCDTPAEPNLTGLVDSNCVYTGNVLDNAGMAFDPDPFNVMSYAPKPCRTQITEDQYQRMSYIATYLRDDIQCPTLTASFIVDDPVAVCTDQLTTTLTYNGTGGTACFWDINDDGIADYDSAVIVHTFSGTGTHKVCLTVTNGVDTVTQCHRDAATILDLHPLPYTESFDSLAHGAMLNPDLHYGWTVGDLGPNYGSYSLLIDNYHYNAVDEEDYFMIGPFDLSSIPVPYLSYRIAYAPYSADRWDALRVEISTDCGATFDELTYAEGLTLSTMNGYVPHQWMPSDSAHWRLEKIPLSAFYNDTILLRFTNITGFGNNLYLDDLTIEPDPLLAFSFIAFKVHPASSGGFDLVWRTADQDHVDAYEIERSRDGTDFSLLDRITVEDPREAVFHYHDGSDTGGQYRIKGILADGSVQYSPIVHASSKSEQPGRAFPNPASDVMFVNDIGGNSPPALYDLMGRLRAVPVQRANGHYRFKLDHLGSGVYLLVNGSTAERVIKY